MFLIKNLLSRQSQTSKKPLITQITLEQLDQVLEYKKKWLEIAQHGSVSDFRTIKLAIENAYHAIALPPPKIIKLFTSPSKLCEAFEIRQDAETTKEKSIHFFLSLSMGIMIIWAMGLFFAGFKAFFILLKLFSKNINNPWFILPTVLIVSWLLLLRSNKASNFFNKLRQWLWIIYFLVVAPITLLISSNHKFLYALAYGVGWVSIWAMVWLKKPMITERLTNQVYKLIHQIKSNLSPQIQKQLDQAFGKDWSMSWETLGTLIIRATPTGKLRNVPDYYINSWSWIELCCWIDFCTMELGCPCNQKLWQSLQILVSSCSMVLPRTNFCYVSPRPIQIRLDDQRRLHGEGEPAIEFAVGTQIYFYHGVLVSDRYGKLHPHQWKADWVLRETNAEIRRILIQGIGYGRLCQELTTQTLDTWREYTLLKIEVPTVGYVNGREVAEEPILLLKMTCPSTHHIHVLRVPPNLRSARQAAKWVNWDIDPQSLAIET